MTISLASSLARLPERERAKHLQSLTEAQAGELLHDWRFWARPEQLAPEGDWHTWLILAGRGFGKTRSGAEWVRQSVCGSMPFSRGKYGRLALIAETAADARDVLVEGESGLLSIHPKDFRPLYEPSKRRLTWPNGARASLYNATEPDQLRGPQFDAGWCDELAKWMYGQETWDMLQFGLRLGDDPRQVVTTTPRPIRLLKEILVDPQTVVTRGSTYDNKPNLAAPFLAKIVKRYEGTRLGRQELNAEILDDVPGALWTRRNLDEYRTRSADLPEFQRVVVAIDPAVTNTEDSSETGIVAAGLGVDGRGYVLGDASCRMSPDGWARRAIALYNQYGADCIVAEVNNGGDMIEQTIRAAGAGTVSVHQVRASRGKHVRAEPISSLYEQGRVSHVGMFAALEDQMLVFTTHGVASDESPDRVDALVWAMTELFPGLVSPVVHQRYEEEYDRDDDARSGVTGY